jgi:hypothetical protein
MLASSLIVAIKLKSQYGLKRRIYTMQVSLILLACMAPNFIFSLFVDAQNAHHLS